MPIYEYQCSTCSHRLEALQKMDAEELLRCPSCNRESLRRLISPTSFRLKGSGWYETDFRNQPKPEADGKEQKEAKEDAPAEKAGDGQRGKDEATNGKARAPAEEGKSTSASGTDSRHNAENSARDSSQGSTKDSSQRGSKDRSQRGSKDRSRD